jgi:phospholipid-binding lipoprotein MlaA
VKFLSSGSMTHRRARPSATLAIIATLCPCSAFNKKMENVTMPASFNSLSLRLACIALLVSLLGGCALGRNPADPLEPLNRGVYQFNDAVDKAIVKPVAQAYRAVIPQFIRSSVSNFFSNINDVIVALNNLLQGKFTAAYSDLGRVLMNSTLGIGGLFDVASEAGVERHEEDFGQTLGYWGVGDGPFLVLPVLGPSNVRDSVGRFVDYHADLTKYVDPSRARNQIWLTRGVNRRAELLDASTVLQTAALDPYEFVRDAYIQRRRNLIHDGSPPPDREFMDPTPPPAKGARAPASPFPSSGEPTGMGSMLVSGESRLPVQSGYGSIPAAAMTAIRPMPQARPGGLTRDLPVSSITSEPLTRAQREMLLDAQAGAAAVTR